mmetsp:Transcript_4392/g.11144  ORF Transcript_4392/g.11144 Transcript_4392/m.11144 type:complete len:364 (-) Transcript_4392:745-1836(-)
MWLCRGAASGISRRLGPGGPAIARPLGRWRSEEKGKYKLVATDLDGTFMRDEGLPPWLQAPSPRNIAAVDELIDRNIYFVLISGRMIVNMAPLLHAMGNRVAANRNVFIAGYNGGLVVGPPTSAIDKLGLSRTAMLTSSLPSDVIESAVAYAEREGLMVKAYYRNADGMCSLASCGEFDYDDKQAHFFYHCGEYPYPADHEVSEARLGADLLEEQRRCPFPIARVDKLEIAALNPYKMLIITDDPDKHMTQAAAALEDINADPAEHLVRGNFWFEYMPRGINKSTALAKLASGLGLSLEECVAFGDSSNDFEMLRDAGMGVAMANARDDVKAVAAYTSRYSNNDDGVGREIEYMLETGAFYEW